MVCNIHYNLNVNKDFVIFLISKFVTCFIDIRLRAFGFNSGNKISISCLFTKGK